MRSQGITGRRYLGGRRRDSRGRRAAPCSGRMVRAHRHRALERVDPALHRRAVRRRDRNRRPRRDRRARRAAQSAGWNEIDTFENDLGRLLIRAWTTGWVRAGPRHRPARGSQAGIGSAGQHWLLPLAVAACVVALVVGTVSATQLLATHRHGPRPGNSVPGTSTPPASNSGTSTVAPAPPVTAGPTRSVTPAGPVVQLGGATLHLPLGWVARDYRGYLTKGVSTLEAQAWCLTPADRPVSTAQSPARWSSAPSRTRRPATRSMWTSRAVT